MSNSISIANERSKVQTLGETFTSDKTGYTMIVDTGYAGEKEEHLEYLLNFRVYKEMELEKDESSIGFHYTNTQNMRRRPIYGKNGWSYQPTMCNTIKVDCKTGEGCPQCHNREELVYHPLVFKTKLCEQMLDSHGCCTKQGRHCAKAHNQYDKRVPNNNRLPDEISRESDLQSLTTDVVQMICENKRYFFEDKMNNIQHVINNGIQNANTRNKIMGKFDNI